MAEAATAAGLALAVPGIVDLLIKYGEWIHQRFETFRNPEPVWMELSTFGDSLANGVLQTQLRLAKVTWYKEDCDDATKKKLEAIIGLLHAESGKAMRVLEKYSADDIGSRLGFAFSGERKCKAVIKQLQSHQHELTQLLLIKDIENRNLPDSVLLSSQRFGIREHGMISVPGTSNPFMAQAEFKEDICDNAIQQVQVLVERQPGNLADISSILHYRFKNNHSKSGILRCLGYREEVHPELVFELPEGKIKLQTLRSIIVGGQSGTGIPLDFRFRIGRQLAEAVLAVNSVGLVHKNIRTDSVLIAQQENHTTMQSQMRLKFGGGSVFLMDWHLLRRHSDVSIQRNASDIDSWAKDIYRHPGRQGSQWIEERYNIGHDVYSLGVCLLEVGLWNVFVDTHNGKPRASDLFRSAAGVEATPDPEGSLKVLLKKPEAIRKILLTLAQEKLHSQMGLDFAELVVRCLTVLDSPSGFGEEIDFREMDKIQQTIAFENLVISSFMDMLL
ncbi:hypothetical protein CcaCcLH18_12172 [Colletotrichum camelliae]|nr:hypothetical protein CcaCcLH18_12172 [Colletotrichum camelliae]